MICQCEWLSNWFLLGDEKQAPEGKTIYRARILCMQIKWSRREISDDIDQHSFDNVEFACDINEIVSLFKYISLLLSFLKFGFALIFSQKLSFNVYLQHNQ